METANTYNQNIFDDRVPEEEKNQKWYLEKNIDYSINSLVRSNKHLQKASDYFAGNRSNEDFKYLEDRHGFGAENELKFYPVIRKHIEVLKGQFLQNPFQFFISCSDSDTLSKINNQRKQLVINQFIQEYDKYLKEYTAYLQASQKDPSAPKPKDRLPEDIFFELEEYYKNNWKSLYEITAQHLLNYLLESRHFDFKSKMVQMFENLLVYGSCYYRVKTTQFNEPPNIEVINPLHFFYAKNTNSTYVKEVTRAVYRYRKTPEEILNEFGHFMTKEQIDNLFSSKMLGQGLYSNSADKSLHEVILNIEPDTVYEDDYNNLIECYDVEWIANNPISYTENGEVKYRWRMDRYSGTRIGDNIYVNMGRDYNSTRSVDFPYKTTISFNGFSYTDYNNEPYSLILKTADIQDKYDLVYFDMYEYISRAGNKGMVIDESLIPEHYGDTPEERLLRTTTYIKQGIYGINSAQDGNQRAQMNTIFNGYDLSIQATAVSAYISILDLLESTISSFTGVPRQMLADIEQRDSVKGIEVSLQQGLVINKHLFHLLENIMSQSLVDAIDEYKKTMTDERGERVLGANSTILKLDKNYLTFTDHNISVSNSIGEKAEYYELKELAMNLAGSQAIEIDAILDILKSKSITEAHKSIKDSYAKKSSAMSQLQQAHDQLQSMQKEIEALNAEINKISQDPTKNNEFKEKMKLEREKLELAREKMYIDKEVKEKHLKAELAQLYDDNEQNNEIYNVK